MKNIHIHIHVRLPDVRQLGLDAAQALREGVESLHGIKQLGEGVKLYTRPAGEEDEAKTIAGAEEKFRQLWNSIVDFADEIRDDIDTICEKDPAARS